MGDRGGIPTGLAKPLAVTVTLSAMIGLSPPAWADEASDVRAGQELAERACSPCHVVAPQAVEGRLSGSAAPSFAEIAKAGKAALESLGAFLRSTHNSVSHPGAMPSPELTEKQIRLISAYMATLRQAK